MSSVPPAWPVYSASVGTIPGSSADRPRHSWFLTALGLAAAVAVAATGLVVTRPRVGAEDLVRVRRDQMTYFYSEWCRKCAEAGPLALDHARGRPELPFRQYDLSDSADLPLRHAYDYVYGVPEAKRLGVPAVLVGEHAYLGLADVHRSLADLPPGAAAPEASKRIVSLLERHAPNVLRGLLVIALLAAALAIHAAGLATHARLRLFIRLLLAAVLLLAAASKASHNNEVVELVQSQWPLPDSLRPFVPPIFCLVTAAEGGIGVLFIAGRPRALAEWSAFAVYAAFLLYAVFARFLSIAGDCGCFHWPEVIGWSTVGRKFGFVVLCYMLIPARR